MHWFPDRVSHSLYRVTGRRHGIDLHLLSRRSLAALFPGRVRILNLGLTLVAIVD